MKRGLDIVGVLAVCLMIVTGCGTGGDEQPIEDTPGDEPVDEQQGDAEDTDFTVGMVTDVGGIDDKSFNQSAWEGLTEFGEEFGLEQGTGYRYVQSSDIADFEPNIRNLVRENVDLAWGVGFLMNDAIKAVAEQNEDAQLAIVDSVVTDDNDDPIDNVANVMFKEHEGSFLVGVAAGLQTETDRVGFVGGVESGLIKKFENGFKAGVKAVNPDAEITVQYAESFNDDTIGAQIANTMYSQGADIIYHAAGATGYGVFNEAINRVRNGEDVWVIGVDRDQHEEGIYEGDQSVTLTSMVKRVDRAVYLVSEQTMNGEFPGGEILEYGLDDEAVGIAPTTDNMSGEALDEIEDYIEDILEGDIDVPETDDEYEEYVDSL
ncbi:BMP family protein [Halalkalibacter sp. APA_J-10(15)]|uniref:BMP family lipoprotein n=1 Tax=Halalkalibacter sp. APA_J-10(15) TaxID=2933805 RepID=UPI001FF49BF8|nr:BMP family ABC transporter substrate-binding protein [Halalkalibacter sp. APA_J-10(15)]MCK0472337.1 BMP family ABC transporter substrate-binding protein [Halalkalibacter sp. APA_J-10(15)]